MIKPETFSEQELELIANSKSYSYDWVHLKLVAEIRWLRAENKRLQEDCDAWKKVTSEDFID